LEESFCKENIWQRRWAIIEIWDLFREENRVFLANEFLMQRDKGKSGIKNYRSDHHEFRDFWWKFHDFLMSGAIKINLEKIK
jgi:hypothetical protein